MNKIFAILLLMAGLIRPAPASAVQWLATTNYVLASGQRLENEAWIMADRITVAGTVGDDLFLAANPAVGNSQPVRLTGTFSNDVWAFGSDIVLSGTVGEHARLLSLKTIRVDGTVARGLTALGNTLELGPRAHIGGDLALMGEDVVVSGTVEGTSAIRGRRITLAGTFHGTVRLTALETIIVTPETTIEGDLHYVAPVELVLDPKVALRGRCIRDTQPLAAKPVISWKSMLWNLTFLCGALLAGMLFMLFFPGFVIQSVQNMERSRWKCLLAGLLAFGLLPMFAALAFVTLVGIPLALLLIGLYGLLLYLSKFVVALMLGRLIFRLRQPPPSPFFILAIGLCATFIAANLPDLIGVAAWLAIAFLGLGSMVITLLDRRIPVLVTGEAGATPPPVPRSDTFTRG